MARFSRRGRSSRRRTFKSRRRGRKTRRTNTYTMSRGGIRL